MAATQADLVSWAAFFRGVVATLAVQVREGFYRNHYLANVFLPLAI